ncbi:MAG: hypothetical protein J6Z22_01310, partial [Lachnospiraceae bacterium]|nr:hypothetical protein [Lachnospiraceae bacterium]
GSGGNGGSGSGSGSGSSNGKKDNLFKNANENIAKLADFMKNPKSFTENDYKDKGQGIESHELSIGFSVSLAFMWEYNPVDDCFYFKSGAITAEASLEFRVEARLAPCPIFYLYIVFGAKVEVSTGFSVLRNVKEGGPIQVQSLGNKTISASSPARLKPGDTMSFNMRIGDSCRGFVMKLKGLVYVEVMDSNGEVFNSGSFNVDGDPNEFQVLLPKRYSSKGVMTVKITAIKDTTFERLVNIAGAESKYIWNGINVAPELSIEAGAGAGLELLKLEIFIKVTLGMSFTFGVYDEDKDDYLPATFDSLDFSAVVGFNLTILFFNYSMDVIGYYLHGERDPESTDNKMIWTDHWGVANDMIDLGGGSVDEDEDEDDKSMTGWQFSSKYGPVTKDGQLAEETAAEKAASRQFSLSKPKDVSNTQQIVKSQKETGLNDLYSPKGVIERSIDANDVNVPFQLSGYGVSGDAFKLVDGMATGYDYKAFAVGNESYILYPISLGADVAADPVDYTQLVLSKVVVTDQNTGLVHPTDPDAEFPYLVVDELDEDGKNTGDLDFDVSVDGSKITVAYSTYERHSDGNADSISVSKTVVIRRATIDVSVQNATFEVTTLTEAGKYQFLPQQEGDITVYAGVKDSTDDAADAMMAQYSSYLQAKYNVTDADLKALKPKAEHFAPASKYQVESIQRSIYGTKNSLFAVTADGQIVEKSLPQFQTLTNMEVGRADGKVAVAYTAEQVIYVDGEGKSTSVMNASTNRGTIKRLYLCIFDEGAWSEPKLLYSVIDFDDYTSSNKSSYPKDGVYTDTALTEEKVDPYFAKLQFLKANLSASVEEIMLFEMNGNTYIIREDQLKSAVNAGSVTVTPIFTEELGTEATLASDYNGNLAMVYVAPVTGTVNNAIYLAWWDNNLGQWGNGNLLAMNHMQVYEDAITYDLSASERELAYLGKTTQNTEYDSYISSLAGNEANYNHARGGMDKFSFSNVQMVLDGVGTDAKLVVFTSGSMTQLADSSYEAGGKIFNTVVNDSDPEIGFYAVAFGAGKQKIGNAKMDFYDTTFSAGEVLAGSVSFTNVGNVGIRGSQSNPITVELTVGSQEIAEWTLTRNVPSGSSVTLAFSQELMQTITVGEEFVLSVYEDQNYFYGNAFTAREVLYEVKSLCDIKVVNCDYVIKKVNNSFLEMEMNYNVSKVGGYANVYDANLVTYYEDANGDLHVLDEGIVGNSVFGLGGTNTGKRTFNVPLSAFLNDGEKTGLYLVTKISTAREEQTLANNTYLATIPHLTMFTAPGNISMALGNTMYLPVSFISTERANDIDAYEVEGSAEDWEAKLGIIYYDKNRNCVVIAPSKVGSGILHIEDKATNSIYAIGFTVTQLGEGVNIFRDNDSFVFCEADGTLTDKEASDQDWTFEEGVKKWAGNTNDSYEAPMNNDLSIANTANASVSFETLATTLTLFFEGDVEVESDLFAAVVESGEGTSPRTYNFNNTEGKAHIVTITAKTDGTKIDRYQATYADGVDPTPVNDEGYPNVYWSRSFPDTASLTTGESVTMTCYALDDVALDSVLWNDKVPADLTKISDALWSFDVTFTENGLYDIAVADKNHNESKFTFRVDWFNNVVSEGAIATAPPAPQLSFQKENGDAISTGVIEYFPYLNNATRLVKDATIAAYYDPNGVFTMNGALSRGEDGRWLATSNGFYLVRITMPDKTWSQALIPMDQIQMENPLLGLSAADRAVLINATDNSGLASISVNGYDIAASGESFEFRFSIDYGGVYEVTATDEAGNATTQSITMSVPITMEGDLGLVPVADENGGSLSISYDASTVKGGDYGNASTPGENAYATNYKSALIKLASEDAEPDLNGATFASKTSYSINEKGWYVLAIRSGREAFVTDAFHFDISTLTNPATCEEDGDETIVSSVNYQGVVTQASYVKTIPALGHDYAAPTYEWSLDHTTCTATRICNRNHTHKETEIATASSEVTTPATCEEDGKTTYTASFTNSAFATQTETITNIPA